MIRTIYFSTARADLSKSEIDELVARAAEANEKNDVTGALAYNGRNFCQCLEGDEAAVRTLMERISRDPRHSGVKVLDEKPIDGRHFPDWSMHLVDGLDFSVVINAMAD